MPVVATDRRGEEDKNAEEYTWVEQVVGPPVAQADQDQDCGPSEPSVADMWAAVEEERKASESRIAERKRLREVRKQASLQSPESDALGREEMIGRAGIADKEGAERQQLMEWNEATVSALGPSPPVRPSVAAGAGPSAVHSLRYSPPASASSRTSPTASASGGGTAAVQTLRRASSPTAIKDQCAAALQSQRSALARSVEDRMRAFDHQLLLLGRVETDARVRVEREEKREWEAFTGAPEYAARVEREKLLRNRDWLMQYENDVAQRRLSRLLKDTGALEEKERLEREVIETEQCREDNRLQLRLLKFCATVETGDYTDTLIGVEMSQRLGREHLMSLEVEEREAIRSRKADHLVSTKLQIEDRIARVTAELAAVVSQSNSDRLSVLGEEEAAWDLLRTAFLIDADKISGRHMWRVWNDEASGRVAIEQEEDESAKVMAGSELAQVVAACTIACHELGRALKEESDWRRLIEQDESAAMDDIDEMWEDPLFQLVLSECAERRDAEDEENHFRTGLTNALLLYEQIRADLEHPAAPEQHDELQKHPEIVEMLYEGSTAPNFTAPVYRPQVPQESEEGSEDEEWAKLDNLRKEG